MFGRFALAAAAWLLAVGAALAAVDANTATREQLDAVRGIGPALSERIVAERSRSPFKDMNDLQQRVRGIGSQTAKKLEAAGLTVGASRSAADGAGAASGGTSSSTVVGRAPSGSSAAGKAAASSARITPLGSGVVTETTTGK